MTTSDILAATRARLTPETWGKGGGTSRSSECLMLALSQVVDHPIRTDAYRLLLTCALGHGPGSLHRWQDATERTLVDVHALFDAAVAIAQDQERAAEIPVRSD